MYESMTLIEYLQSCPGIIIFLMFSLLMALMLTGQRIFGIMGFSLYSGGEADLSRVEEFSMALNAAEGGLFNISPILLLPPVIVIVAVALTDETRRIMNAERFAAMKQDAVFINASRGALVDESALIAALNDKLSGAALDVFDIEPLPEDSPLWRSDKLLISPHNSFVGENNHARLMEVVVKNLTASTL